MRTDDGFHVEAGSLDDASAATRLVADRLRAADLGRPVRAAAVALPGSATASAAASLIVSWSAQSRALADDLAAHAAALAASADTYRLADAAVLDTLTARPGR